MSLKEKYEYIIDQLANNDFAIVDGLFDSAVLTKLKDELLNKEQKNKLTRAKIGSSKNNILNNSVRSDEILWIENDSDIECERRYFLAVETLYNYLNEACYTGISDFEFHYSHYAKGAFYKVHIDRFKNDSSRKFSLITYLNESWKDGDGGELKLHFDTSSKLIEPLFGRTIIFKSHLISHEVLKSNTNRYSITGWMK